MPSLELKKRLMISFGFILKLDIVNVLPYIGLSAAQGQPST